MPTDMAATIYKGQTSLGVPACPDGFDQMKGSVAIPRGGIRLPSNTKVVELKFTPYFLESVITPKPKLTQC